MRHLYNRKSEPGVEAAIEQAKAHFERRRCGHHPDEYPEPLSALECVCSVVDPKDNGVNKHRYICAINDEELRANLRQITGTPLLFIRRSVMIMEPMATVSAKARSKDERSKLRAELKTPASKRKREDEDDDDEKEGSAPSGAATGAEKPEKKKKRSHGQKEPNPLAVKKKKSKSSSDEQGPKTSKAQNATVMGESEPAEGPKRKRRRKHKSQATATSDEAFGAAGVAGNATVEVSTVGGDD